MKFKSTDNIFITTVVIIGLIVGSLSINNGFDYLYASTTTTTPGAVEAEPEEDKFLVVINAGHQGKGNYKTEPYGPGAKKRKPRVAGGTKGVATKTKESVRNLQVAKRLAKSLEDEGIKVYMIRTKEKVNIPNSKRSKRANKRKADLVINLHCDASYSSSPRGITMLVPKKNKWSKKFYKKSEKAGKIVLKQVIKATKAKSRGISKRSDLSSFNYSKVPTILIEMGFMTNIREDKRLKKVSYQKKLTKGMTKGIVNYLDTLEK